MGKWMLLGILAGGLAFVGASNVAEAGHRSRGCDYGYGSGSYYSDYGYGYSSPYSYGGYSSYSPYRSSYYGGYSSHSPYGSSLSITFGRSRHHRRGHHRRGHH